MCSSALRKMRVALTLLTSPPPWKTTVGVPSATWSTRAEPAKADDGSSKNAARAIAGAQRRVRELVAILADRAGPPRPRGPVQQLGGQRFAYTDTCAGLRPVNGSRCHPPQRSSKVIPARRAIRSSSAGQTYRISIGLARKVPSSRR